MGLSECIAFSLATRNWIPLLILAHPLERHYPPDERLDKDDNDTGATQILYPSMISDLLGLREDLVLQAIDLK